MHNSSAVRAFPTACPVSAVTRVATGWLATACTALIATFAAPVAAQPETPLQVLVIEGGTLIAMPTRWSTFATPGASLR